MYGGWLRNIDEGEKEPSYAYAAKTALKAEEIGIDSIWIADHMLNPLKGERAKSLEAWTTLTALAVITRKIELFHILVNYQELTDLILFHRLPHLALHLAV